MRVLVCGGRDFFDEALLGSTLDRLRPPPAVIIHGDAAGADRRGLSGGLADAWARRRPTGNRLMLVKGKPDMVIAFPGGRGTANMVQQARAAGVRVFEVT